MKPFNMDMIDPVYYRESDRKPDFSNLLKVLRLGRPDRYTLFEFAINHNLMALLTGMEDDTVERQIKAFAAAGYDYVITPFSIPSSGTATVQKVDTKTISLNEHAYVTDRESFESLKGSQESGFDFTTLDEYANKMPTGMKLAVCGPGGVLENVIGLTGYDNLCYMLEDDEALVGDIFDHVGNWLTAYYEKCVPHEAVGLQVINDDWGFNSQTMISPAHLRRYVFPWHKKILQIGRKCGKPVILHACGNLAQVEDDIINNIRYDGKHSYEDNIIPVEDAYERYNKKIAVLGGIDVDFLCRSTPEAIYLRAAAMLEKTKAGGYALGSGNSIPYYVPNENYLAMIAAAHFNTY